MRRKLAAGAAVLAVAGAVWVAAPALSLAPYTPRAVDFEQTLPEARALDPVSRAAAHDEGPVRFKSPVVEARRRFDLVGIAGEVRPYEIRVREEGGGWSEWLELSDGNPLYAGGAVEVQVRSRSFKPEGDLHYVNVSGTSGGLGDRLLNSARATINEAFIKVAAVPAAQAKIRRPRRRKRRRRPPVLPQPPYVNRAAWGADVPGSGCPPGGPPTHGAVKGAVVHHTVSATDYTPEEAPGMVLGICRFHRYGNGWNDIGYNALVDRFGQLYEGRAGGLYQAVAGAHTEGFNSQLTGIASLGTHTTVPIEPAGRTSLIAYLAWKLSIHRAYPATLPAGILGASSATRVEGHNFFNSTSCPGAAFSAEIPAIRQQVQALIKSKTKRKKKRRRKKRRMSVAPKGVPIQSASGAL